MSQVELRNCYAWDCPDCMYKNIVEQFFNTIHEPIEREIPGTDDTIVYGCYEVGPKHNGVVFCQRCESRFDVKPPELLEDG